MDEKLREKFEAWFSDGGKWPQAIERSRDGYKLITAQNAVLQARAKISGKP